MEDYVLLEMGLARAIEDITQNLQQLKREIVGKLRGEFDFLSEGGDV